MYQSIYLSIYILSIIFHLSPSLYVSPIYLYKPNHEGGISSEPLPDLQVQQYYQNIICRCSNWSFAMMTHLARQRLIMFW